MSIVVKARVLGLKELDNALAKLPKSAGKGALRKALKKAGQPIFDAAKMKVPVDTGALKESLEISTKLSRRQKRGRRKQGAVELFIGAGRPKGSHAHLVEFGTSRSSPRPFLRPAWDENKGKILRIFGKELWLQIEKAAKKLAKKAGLRR